MAHTVTHNYFHERHRYRHLNAIVKIVTINLSAISESEKRNIIALIIMTFTMNYHCYARGVEINHQPITY